MDALRRARALGLALAALGGAAGCTVPGLPGSPAEGWPGDGGATTIPSDDSGCGATLGQEVMARVNEIRASHGLAPLVAEPRLVGAAARHSADQARHRFSDHAGSDGSLAADRIEATGYRWVFVAENVAQGYPSPRAVVAGWMNSPPHRAAILAPRPVHAGVGYAAGHVDMRHFWTLKIAAPATGLAVRPLDCHP